MKRTSILILLLLQIVLLHAQRSPSKEILVFFATGTEQVYRYSKTDTIKQAKIKTEDLVWKYKTNEAIK